MKLTNALNLPQPFVDAATSDYRFTPRRYSATALLKGPREAILARRHADEITEDVADRVWAIFGSAVHSILEGSQESATQLKECKLEHLMPNGYTLSGIFDLYDDATGTAIDYKTASVWKVKFGEFDDWRDQLLIYVWLLQQAGFDAHRGQIVALLKDHSKAKAERGEHPPFPVFVKEWDFSQGQIDDMGRWLEQRFEFIAEAEAKPDDELPLCSREERWRKGECYAVKREGTVKAKKLFKVDELGDGAKEMADAYASECGPKFYVEYRPGEDGKCLKYCAAREFCGHYRAIQEAGDAL